MLEMNIQYLLDAGIISVDKFGKFRIEYESFLVSKLDAMGVKQAVEVLKFLKENGDDEFPFYTSKKVDDIMKTLGF